MNQCLVLILCKDRSKKIISLENSISSNHTDFLTVCDSLTLNLDKKLLDAGFYNLTRSPYIKKPSAWDKAFYTISYNELYNKYNYFFFIEDDVYSKNYECLNEFIHECINNFHEDFITKQVRPQSHHPNWKYWKENYISDLKHPSQSFNPLCRISNKLIKLILNYQRLHKKFEFHEILIASLCLENNLSYINYIENDNLKKYIGRFRYNPILLVEEITDNLIYHPVKDSKDAREKSLSCG